MELIAADELTSSQLAGLFSQAYSDYVLGRVKLGPESFSAWCRNNLVSLTRSIIALDPEPVGFIMMSCRDDRPIETHVAAMGVVPRFRRRSYALQMLTVLAKNERAHGVQTIDPDTFDNNVAAFEVFRKAGFLVIHDLPGWERATPEANEFGVDGSLIECPMAQVNTLVRRFAEDNLPWQTHEFILLPQAENAFKLGHAYCVVSDPYSSRDNIKLQCLFVEPEWRRRGEVTKLVKAMMARFPGKKWGANPIFPGEYARGIAGRLGFQLSAMSQKQMQLKL